MARPRSSPSQETRPGQTPLLVLGHGLVGLHALRLGHGAGSVGDESIVASERILLLEIREQHGEEVWVLASEYPLP